MKIMCQEHYDKVVQYAESIGDSTLRECLERLERREKSVCNGSNAGSKIPIIRAR